MITVEEWLAILLPDFTVSEGAIRALSTLCGRVYDLNAAVSDGYEESYLIALYIAANQIYAIEGSSGSLRPVSGRKEGKVSVTYGTGKNGETASGWKGTSQGKEFLEIMHTSRGGTGLIGHAS